MRSNRPLLSRRTKRPARPLGSGVNRLTALAGASCGHGQGNNGPSSLPTTTKRPLRCLPRRGVRGVEHIAHVDPLNGNSERITEERRAIALGGCSVGNRDAVGRYVRVQNQHDVIAVVLAEPFRVRPQLRERDRHFEVTVVVVPPLDWVARWTGQPRMARQAKTILRGALQLAVMAEVLGANPVRDVQPLRSKTQPKGAVGLTAEQVRDLLQKVRESQYCRNHDLVDPITLLIATGLRRSELLGMRWVDFDGDARTLAVTGKVVRVAGDGLKRVDETKSAAGRRTVPLPLLAVAMLTARRLLPFLGEADVIFPSTAGTLRDPNNFGKEWRTVRDELGVAEVTTHSFRKTVATLIDDDGLSARIGADHLGHSHVSMTQDRYMTRGRIHAQVADLLDRTVSKSGE